jgi:uncharacterized coiled-coil protein SlyX
MAELNIGKTTGIKISLATFIFIVATLLTLGFTFSNGVTEIRIKIADTESTVKAQEATIQKLIAVQTENQAKFAEIKTDLEWLKSYLKGENK